MRFRFAVRLASHKRRTILARTSKLPGLCWPNSRARNMWGRKNEIDRPHIINGCGQHARAEAQTGQGMVGRAIERLRGDWFNVAGNPWVYSADDSSEDHADTFIDRGCGSDCGCVAGAAERESHASDGATLEHITEHALRGRARRGLDDGRASRVSGD